MALGMVVQFAAQGLGGGQVVGAIEQQGLVAPAPGLQAAGPAGSGKALADGGPIQGPALGRQGLQHAQRHGAVAGLHLAGQPQAPGIEIQGLQPAQLGADGAGPLVQHRRHLGVLGGAAGQGIGLEHGGLLACDGGQAGAQPLLVIETHRGETNHPPLRMAAGGIQPPPHAHLQHRQFHSRCSEGAEGRGGDQFKGAELELARDRLDALQQALQFTAGDRCAPQLDALGPAHQVR